MGAPRANVSVAESLQRIGIWGESEQKYPDFQRITLRSRQSCALRVRQNLGRLAIRKEHSGDRILVFVPGE